MENQTPCRIFWCQALLSILQATEMKNIIQFFKVAVSSRITWFVLIFSFFLFNAINFILRDLLYRLSIINTKYIIFWNPDYYAFDAHNIPYIGLNYVFFTFYFFATIILLYFSNRNKVIDLKINSKIKYFIAIYFILSLPISFTGINPYQIFLKGVVFEYISLRYGEFVKQDFKNNTVYTPHGNFQMFQKYEENFNQAREIALTMTNLCKQSIQNGKEDYCYHYPWKISY